MHLSVRHHPEGVTTDAAGQVAYDLEADEAVFGAATVAGPALVWELGAANPAALLSAEVELDPAVEWLVRCDRVDFPPGGVAHLHTHPGPGIRVLLHGGIHIDSVGESRHYGPLDPWFERGPDPVFARVDDSAAAAFVRVMVLPREWEGRRTIHYVDPADADKPKTQTATVFGEHAVELGWAGMRNGGQILCEQLRRHGVDTVFTVPGESFLPLLDALYDARAEIELVVNRQEGGSTNMADAYGKLTGRPGIALVTRGPGATNASIGVHTTFQDSTPMILLIGQVSREHLGREAFQEIDHRNFFAELTKWSAQIDDVATIPDVMRRAFHVACSGRPGPVAVALPEDMLAEAADVADADPVPVDAAEPSAGDIEAVRGALAEATRPLMVVGGGGWTAQTGRDLVSFAEASAIPVAASFRCQDYVDNRSPAYAGPLGVGPDPRLTERVREADLLLVIGARMGEMTTRGYTLVDVPRPQMTFVHVYPGAEELGRVYEADVAVHSSSPAFAAALAASGPVDGSARTEWVESARADHLEHRTPPEGSQTLDLAQVIGHLDDALPDDAIITNGAGNYSVWAHRFYQFTQYRTQLGPTSGAMGYAIPAAVAAKVVHPERPVVAITGDGDGLMTIQELATAAQYGLDPVILVVNNSRYGTIRMHQERHFPGRVHGTDLANPDFVALAEAFGGHGELVTSTGDFDAALTRCLAAGRFSLIELRTDPDQLTPNATVAQIRGD